MRFKLRSLYIDDAASAKRAVERTLADEAGVAKMKDKARSYVLKAEGLKAPGANILKQEMLSLGGDAAVARGVVNCSTPLSDVVIMGTRKQIKRLVPKLKPQPFGLKALASEITAFLEAEGGPQCLTLPDRVLDLETRPLVMGILNVTPDSFSDGSDHFDREKAVSAALRMVEEGADIIDIGGESTRPGADPVSLEEEVARVVPVIAAIRAKSNVAISIDTYKAEVARRAVAAGAGIINDISGLNLDPEMAAAAAQTGAAVVLMHMRGTPRDMQTDTSYADLVGEVYRLLDESMEKALCAGVKREAIALDPGIGFGKTPEGNLLLLRRLKEFTSLGRPLLVGASRKSFIGKFLGIPEPKERLNGSLAAAVLAVAGGARIIRAHDVAATRQAVDLAYAVLKAGEV